MQYCTTDNYVECFFAEEWIMEIEAKCFCPIFKFSSILDIEIAP